MKGKTKKQYEELLNKIGYSLSSNFFFIGGKQRTNWGSYGTLLRRYDPIAFEVGYNDWCKQ
jgi:hypothetical protein